MGVGPMRRSSQAALSSHTPKRCEAAGAGTEVLVASGGGHLAQLLQLRDQLGISAERCLWVTYDGRQGRELATRELVIFGHGPSTRNARAAVRNYRLAQRLFDTLRVSRVVSTGAGIAVPFLVEAARQRIRAKYVESATCTDGPSLSGRILERIPGVSCAAQWPWGRRGWGQAPCVFDGFTPEDSDRRVDGRRRVLVTLGTHPRYRFDRLVARVARVVNDTDDVVWQLGKTARPSEEAQVVDGLSPECFGRLVAQSDVVIGHAGTGTALKAFQKGKYPILVPRRKEHGEHVDDHQLRLARRLEQLGLALSPEVDELSTKHLDAVTHKVVTVAT